MFNTSKKIQSPILLITYNRPTLTYNLLKSLGELKISRLYIYVDAASGDIDEKSNLQVKKMVEDFQPKFEVIKVFRENNLGCKNGVYQAINEVLSTEDRIIILEDDLWPEVNFFYFCDEMLAKYKEETKFLSISGNSFFNLGSEMLVSKYPHVWGWATWKRAWSFYDLNLSDWDPKTPPNWFKSYPFKNDMIKNYWKTNFDSIFLNEIDTWDFQLSYCSLKFNLLNIHPPVNLVKNLGFSNSATHTKYWFSKPVSNNLKLDLSSFGPASLVNGALYDVLWENHLVLIQYKKITYLIRNIFSLFRKFFTVT